MGWGSVKRYVCVCVCRGVRGVGSEAAEAKTVRGVCCLPPPSADGGGNKWK